MKKIVFKTKSFLIYLLLSVGLLPLNLNANADSCVSFYQGKQIQDFHSVDFLAPFSHSLIEALSLRGVAREGLFSAKEREEFPELDWKSVRLKLRKANVTPETTGLLFEPSSRGLVVNTASPLITPDRSEKLFNELTKYSPKGDWNMFAIPTRNLDKGMLKNLDLKNIRHPIQQDSFHKVPDQVFVNEFINYINRRGETPTEHLEYIKVILENMILSARIAQGPNHQKKLNGIRMRVKSEGKGFDFDTVHTDSQYTSVASTLSIIGLGTEAFLTDSVSNTLDLRIVSTNQIAHMLGDESGFTPVKHRATTSQGKRIVFLLFWN